MQVKYCARCGSHVSEQMLVGDTRPRLVCDQRGFVHYQNPKVVVGCIVQHRRQTAQTTRQHTRTTNSLKLPVRIMRLQRSYQLSTQHIARGLSRNQCNTQSTHPSARHHRLFTQYTATTPLTL